MPRKTIPVKIQVSGSEQVAPGFTNYRIKVSKGGPKLKALKIDDRFAKSFLARITRDAPRMATFTRKISQQ